MESNPSVDPKCVRQHFYKSIVVPLQFLKRGSGLPGGTYHYSSPCYRQHSVSETALPEAVGEVGSDFKRRSEYGALGFSTAGKRRPNARSILTDGSLLAELPGPDTKRDKQC